MDHKPWLWRKKSSEKTILASDKVDISLKRIDDEVQTFPAEIGPVKTTEQLNQKLASIILDRHATADLDMKHEKTVQEANAGREKAEAEAAFLKKELDEALTREIEANEKLTRLDASIKEITQQLKFVREEQEQKIHDAVMKASIKYDKARIALDGKLTETSKRVMELAIENANLSKALLVKDEVIEDQHERKMQAEAEFSTILARLDSAEKENAFLKYEFCVLEKELEIRNEEIEYSRQSADAARKQHLAGVKKISKLESECQRLRLLLRKRVPGPAVEMPRRDQMEMRRRKLNPDRSLVIRDHSMQDTIEIQTDSLNNLIEQLRYMEEENNTLKQIVVKKNEELCSSRLMCSRTSSGLSHTETQMKWRTKDQNNSIDARSDDVVSSSSSWANALISELEHFTDGNHRNFLESKALVIPEMTLMDDFVEMEKLAIVSLGAPSEGGCYQVSSGKELVTVAEGQSSSGDTEDASAVKYFDWLQVVLSAIAEQKRISKRSQDEILEDIKIALGNKSKDVDMEQENKRLKDALKDMKNKLNSATEKLRESVEAVGRLQAELKTLKESKEISEDQIEEQKSINEDLDTQLTIAKAKLKEVFQKCSSMEVELEYKINCCEELEATCLELQLQLESVAKETPNIVGNQEEKQSQNGWEIAAASVKLAECQETILNIGKQLKVFSSNNGAANNNKRLNKRFSLRDQMLADAGTKADNLKSQYVKEALITENTEKQLVPMIPNTLRFRVGSMREIGNAAVMALAIVPSKKTGFLRKLLLRRKKGISKACRSTSW